MRSCRMRRLILWVTVILINVADSKIVDPTFEVEETDDSYRKLYRDTLRRLGEPGNRAIVPHNVTTNGPFNVDVAISLFQISHLDPHHNLAKISTYFEMVWQHDRLRWNPQDYDNLTEIYINVEFLWIPEFYAYYSIEGDWRREATDVMGHVTYDGRVMIFVPFIVTTFCPLNVKYFPFDTQQCEFQFGSWIVQSNVLAFKLMTNEVNLHNFYDNQEWTLTSATMNETEALWYLHSTKKNASYSTVTLYLVVSRESFYYVFNLVLPVTLVSIVSIVGCHAWEANGVRTTKFRLGIMTQVSLGVMLLNVVQEMPKFSLNSVEGRRGSFSDVPILGIFYAVLIVNVGVATCSSTFFVYIYHLSLVHCRHHGTVDEKTTWWVRLIACNVLASQCRPKKRKSSKSADEQQIPHRNRQLSYEFAMEPRSGTLTRDTESPKPELTTPRTGACGDCMQSMSEIRTIFATCVRLIEVVTEQHGGGHRCDQATHDARLLWQTAITRLHLFSLSIHLGIVLLMLLFLKYPNGVY